MIFTFYSYKGGVGRSLALAHVAYAFAERGLRVLAVDFDLEAPGLERYCFASDEIVRSVRDHPGLVDLILDYRRALTSPAEFEKRSFRDWKQFVVSVHDPVNDRGGRLDLMTAGRRGSPEQLRDYSLTVRTFDWPDFFHNWNGEGFFKWLRDEWTRADIGYDVVLVDSRTGVTEMGGVCAYQLADVAVLLCAPNYQNLDGTVDVMRDFTSPGVVALRGDRALRLLAVLARLEPGHPGRARFLKDFADRLGPLPFGPGVGVSYADLALPYLPPFAVSEPIIGGPDATASEDESAAFGTLTEALRTLADALTLLALPGSRLDADHADALAALRGGRRTAAVRLQADTSRRSAGYDFFIDYGKEDAACANELARVLRAGNFEVFIDTTSLEAGSNWAAEIETAIDYSACVLVCFGLSSTSGIRKDLLLRLRNSRRGVTIVPVILPNGSDTAPHFFGLEGDSYLDLRDGVAAAPERLAAFRRPPAEGAARGESSMRVEPTAPVNPYRGAQPYGEDDARFFFGRDEELQRLLALLDESPVVWVEGAAKVGKTSLVTAGVVPALRAAAAAAGPALRVAIHDASGTGAWPRWAASPGAPEGGAGLREAAELIVIDHLDSFAGASPADVRHERRAAMKVLVATSAPMRRLILVGRGVGLDDDTDDDRPVANAPAEPSPLPDVRRFVLGRLQGDRLRQAITEPAQKAGHLLENGLCERLIESAGDSPGAMLQIQLALTSLWELRREGWLTNRALDGLNHLAGVYRQHLRACLDTLSDPERTAAAVLFRTLCQLEPTGTVLVSTAAPWSQAGSPAALRAVGAAQLRDRLAADGLIDLWRVESARRGGSWFLVALARADARIYFDDASLSADTDFMAWRGRLAPTLLHWQQGAKAPNALLTDTALGEAAHWLGLRGDELTEAERDFVEASRDALRLRGPSHDGGPAEAIAIGEPALPEAPGVEPLRVSVLNADLKFVSGPLMLGHYRSLRLTGSEAVANAQVSGALSKRLEVGLYPDTPGANAVIGNNVADRLNPFAMARPAAIVVVGLGDEGRLRSADLVHSVRQAVLSFLERQPAPERPGEEVLLSSTLMGSGAISVSTGSCAQLVAQGVREANRKRAAAGAPVVNHLQFVELYHDRACEAWRALRNQGAGRLGVMQLVDGVASGAGALRRALASSYRGTTYDIFSAVTIQHGDSFAIGYTIDTRHANGEVRAQASPGALLRELVAKGSNDATYDAQIGRTLFELLVPIEVEPFLAGTSDMVLELDGGTAGLPWELLDTSIEAPSDARPWALRTKLLRKLRTSDFRAHVADASTDGVLVVGEPLVDAALYPPLPGARSEAEAVAAVYGEAAAFDKRQIKTLAGGNDARTIINALFERPYRIVHLTGHAAPGASGGLVLSGGTYLGPAEIRAMRVVPELVFVNCCHLASGGPSGANTAYDRAVFAANLAEDLTLIGVRCVVVAGWAVDDSAALKFATSFHSALLAGSRFLDAVGAARSAAWEANRHGAGWGAYQCYGDPDWSLRPAAEAALAPLELGERFADVASPVDLALALETVSTRLRFGTEFSSWHVVERTALDRIRFLEDRYAPAWGKMGAIAEAFGLAYADARDLDRSIDWYRRALGAEDASASFKAAEALASQLARRGASNADITLARRDLEETISCLERLVAVQTTSTRESLLGSAYKRLAMLDNRSDAGRQARNLRRHAVDRLAASRGMALHYGNAERLSRATGAEVNAYPAKNSISADLRLAFLERRAPELSAGRFAIAEESLARVASERPDFWSVVARIELRLLAAVAARRLARQSAALIDEFRAVKARVPSPSMWNAVHDEARFTLEPYQSVATAVERRAAQALLDALAEMAAA